MNKLKFFTISIIFAFSVLFVPFAANAEATPNEAEIISQNDDFVPLYTKAENSSLKNHSSYMTADQGIVFYTQTTALAFVAGYLILFKLKGIPEHEKMHGRRKNKNQ